MPGECMPIHVLVSVLGLVCPLHGPIDTILVGVIGCLVSRWWQTTTVGCWGLGVICVGQGVIILVVMIVETNFIACCPIFFCSIG